jgi:hypothetical protein
MTHSRPHTLALMVLAAWSFGGCGLAGRPEAPPDMNPIAERYVKLVLAVGQHDADYVDAYYGDPAWKPAGEPVPLADLAREAAALRAGLAGSVPANAEETVRLRHEYLDRQIASVEARIAMLGGERFTFDEEARRLYDAQPPHKTEAEFQAVLDELETLLPGQGPQQRGPSSQPRGRFVGLAAWLLRPAADLGANTQ